MNSLVVPSRPQSSEKAERRVTRSVPERVPTRSVGTRVSSSLLTRHGSRVTPRSAFTLVEMLVVIAVILILASLLMPTIDGAMRSARRATCRNHLAQLTRAMNNYALSFTQFLPTQDDDAEGGVGTGFAFDAWNVKPGYVGLGLLIGYGGLTEKDGKIFYCPHLNTRLWDASMPGYWDALYGHGMYNYTNEINTWYGWHRVKQGTRTIYGYQYRGSGFSERPDAPYGGGFGRGLSMREDSSRAVVADQLDWRFGPDFCHKDGLNVGYVDGHVVWFHDRLRYIQTTGYSWTWDQGRSEYEFFWRLFDKNLQGGVEVSSLAK